MQQTVSIVIPSYNSQDTLKKCLDSALAQTIKPVEIIVVDDASTDNTPEILKSYGDQIKVITHQTNQGVGVSRGDGIREATGDYVYFLDSDDWLEPDAIEILVAGADGGDIVTGFIDSKPLSGLEAQKEFLHSKVTFLCDRLIRRSLFDQEPITDLRYFEDLEVMPRLLYRAKKVTYVKRTGYHHIKNEESLTATSTQTKHLVYKVLVYLNMCLYFLENQPDWIMELDLPGLLLTGLLGLYVEAKTNPDEFNKYDAQTDEILNLLEILLAQARQ